MAKVVLEGRLGLEKPELLQLLAEHFQGKYQVRMSRSPRVDFIVKKSAVSGAAVQVRVGKTRTTITVNRCEPSPLLRMSGWSMFYGVGRGVQKDVCNFFRESATIKAAIS